MINERDVFIDEVCYSAKKIEWFKAEAVDPKLIALKIFLKSKNDKNIELQSNKILGFYDPKLIEYEREYAKRFNKSNSSVLIKKLGKKS